MKKITPSIALLCFLSSLVYSQNRLSIYGTDVIDAKQKSIIQLSLLESSSSEEAIKKIPEYFISSYSNDNRFIVIDKKNQQLISDEKERQKSEDFIDGYIVDQGKMEGTDYIVRSFITNKGKDLVARVYDVKGGTILCEASTSFRNIKYAVDALVAEINMKCFELSYEVVRVEEEKKGKAKMILILGGYGQNLGRRDILEIYTIVEEKIGDQTVSRKKPIGKGVINNVQDENFSSVKILEGGSEISALLSDGKKLRCIIK